MDQHLETPPVNIERRRPAANIDRLREIAATHRVGLPPDYIECMTHVNSGEGDVSWHGFNCGAPT